MNTVIIFVAYWVISCILVAVYFYSLASVKGDIKSCKEILAKNREIDTLLRQAEADKALLLAKNREILTMLQWQTNAMRLHPDLVESPPTAAYNCSAYKNT